MQTYFLADPHFGRHGTGTVGRPFSSSLEMSHEIIANVNSKVSKYNRLVIVGDFAFREPAYWRQQLVCKNCILILGNHDPREKCKHAFGPTNVRDTFDAKINGQRVFCSHYPHCFWPASHKGSYHVYGHCHDNRTASIEQVWPGIRSMDVGVDAAKRLLGAYTCFSQDEVFELLSVRSGHDTIAFYDALRDGSNQSTTIAKDLTIDEYARAMEFLFWQPLCGQTP